MGCARIFRFHFDRDAQGLGETMSAAAATNKVTPPAHSHLPQHSGISVNAAIPVGRMEPWRREAIQKVMAFGSLQANWDSHGSRAPSRSVRASAIDLLLSVPGEIFPAPRIVPVSGGGFHFEWSVGDRELEIYIDSDRKLEALRVQHGMPIDDDPSMDLQALFSWLASH